MTSRHSKQKKKSLISLSRIVFHSLKIFLFLSLTRSSVCVLRRELTPVSFFTPTNKACGHVRMFVASFPSLFRFLWDFFLSKFVSYCWCLSGFVGCDWLLRRNEMKTTSSWFSSSSSSFSSLVLIWCGRMNVKSVVDFDAENWNATHDLFAPLFLFFLFSPLFHFPLFKVKVEGANDTNKRRSQHFWEWQKKSLVSFPCAEMLLIPNDGNTFRRRGASSSSSLVANFRRSFFCRPCEKWGRETWSFCVIAGCHGDSPPVRYTLQ